MALGYDEGVIMIKLGREEPAMSMDTSGKFFWAERLGFTGARVGPVAAKRGEQIGIRAAMRQVLKFATDFTPGRSLW